jgi:hypothetical protein
MIGDVRCVTLRESHRQTRAGAHPDRSWRTPCDRAFRIGGADLILAIGCHPKVDPNYWQTEELGLVVQYASTQASNSAAGQTVELLSHTSFSARQSSPSPRSPVSESPPTCSRGTKAT